MEYRMLEVGELIQEGDEFVTSSGEWLKCTEGVLIGEECHLERDFRRPVCIEPAPVVTKREGVLDEAKVAILKDRNATHGNPEDNFATIAAYWNTYIASIKGRQLQPHDVAVMMGHVKDSRIATSPECKDHWVDKAGYSGCGWECVGKEGK